MVGLKMHELKNGILNILLLSILGIYPKILEILKAAGDFVFVKVLWDKSWEFLVKNEGLK